MDTADLKNAFAEFAVFARQLKGDEKGEAQTFLDHFFRALGHQGVIEAGRAMFVSPERAASHLLATVRTVPSSFITYTVDTIMNAGCWLSPIRDPFSPISIVRVIRRTQSDTKPRSVCQPPKE